MRPHVGDRQGARIDLKKPLTMQQLREIFDFFEGRDQKGVQRVLVAPFSSTCSAAEQLEEKGKRGGGEKEKRGGWEDHLCPSSSFPIFSSAPTGWARGNVQTF